MDTLSHRGCRITTRAERANDHAATRMRPLPLEHVEPHAGKGIHRASPLGLARCATRQAQHRCCGDETQRASSRQPYASHPPMMACTGHSGDARCLAVMYDAREMPLIRFQLVDLAPSVLARPQEEGHHGHHSNDEAHDL